MLDGSSKNFSGADDTDGGRFVSLPSDFLQAYGSQRHNRSAIVEADGDRWGREIEADEDDRRGDLYYIRGEELWVARNARLPDTVYLDYHYRHPVWDDTLTDGNIDFPLEARPLIPAEAAYYGMTENWLPGARDYHERISGARSTARERARHVARRTKAPRTVFKPQRVANRW